MTHDHRYSTSCRNHKDKFCPQASCHTEESHYLHAKLDLHADLTLILLSFQCRLLDLHSSNSLDSNSFRKFCEKPHLQRRHQEFCENGTNILQVIGKGVDMAIDECQHQFRMSRWNCSFTENTTKTVFGGALASRESVISFRILCVLLFVLQPFF